MRRVQLNPEPLEDQNRESQLQMSSTKSVITSASVRVFLHGKYAIDYSPRVFATVTTSQV